MTTVVIPAAVLVCAPLSVSAIDAIQGQLLRALPTSLAYDSCGATLTLHLRRDEDEDEWDYGTPEDWEVQGGGAIVRLTGYPDCRVLSCWPRGRDVACVSLDPVNEVDEDAVADAESALGRQLAADFARQHGHLGTIIESMATLHYCSVQLEVGLSPATGEQPWAVQTQRALLAVALVASPEFVTMSPARRRAAQALASDWTGTPTELLETIEAAFLPSA